MIKILEGLPDNVLGVEATGEVTDSDYETVLNPAVRAMRESHDRLRIIYVFGKDFDGWSLGGMWEDAKLGLKHPKSWEKIAVVSDEDRIKHMIKAFGWMVPGEVRIFDLTQLDAAKDWAAN
ncbi:MAG TPA: STAS/SEC14 domain-containing protein [Thermomicrobiales bacterium]|nr:STAS/SEC14 domain-containing protein [Thermomicrobiales bacterium]